MRRRFTRVTGDRGRLYGGQSEDERRAERRERLLAVGAELFGRDGWDGTGIERICSESGVATRYFYEEFRGREDLLESVYRASAGAAVAVVHEVLSRPGPPEERVAAGFRAYVRHVTAEPGRVRLLHQDARRLPTLAPVLREMLVSYWWSMSEAAAGRPLPTGPAPVLDDRTLLRARAVSGAMNEILAHWLSMPEPRPPVEPMVEQIVRLLTPSLLSSVRSA